MIILNSKSCFVSYPDNIQFKPFYTPNMSHIIHTIYNHQKKRLCSYLALAGIFEISKTFENYLAQQRSQMIWYFGRAIFDFKWSSFTRVLLNKLRSIRRYLAAIDLFCPFSGDPFISAGNQLDPFPQNHNLASLSS